MSVQISAHPLSVTRAYAALEDRKSGGVVLFLGRVRPDRHRGRAVRGLVYEVHRSLARKALEGLRDEARRRYPVRRVVIWHRTGKVPVGEPSVIIGVAAAHRSMAFDAARFLIDELKVSAPIWKTDVYGRASKPRNGSA